MGDRGTQGQVAGQESSGGVRSGLVLLGLLTIENSPTSSEFKVGFVLFGNIVSLLAWNSLYKPGRP